MRLVLLGPPGAGKGTQALVIADYYNIPQVSTGNIFRSALQNETQAGLAAKEFVDAGELVPDEIVIEVVRERLTQADTRDGFILDGFPRTTEQAEALKSLLNEFGQQLNAVVKLDVARDELLNRVLERAQIEGRTDDTEPVVLNRLAHYENETRQVVDYYRAAGLLREVDGQGPMEAVTNRIQQAIQA